jgi:hypothetical protein
MSSQNASKRSSFSSFKSLMREHHAGVNGAVDLLYGGPRLSHPTKSPKTVAVNTEAVASQDSLAPLKKTKSSRWQEFKALAREHHRAVNAAYDSLYGNGAYRGAQIRQMGVRSATRV